MKMLTTTRSVGGSLVVTLPKELVKLESLTSNQIIEIQVKKAKVNLLGLAKGVGPFTEDDQYQGQLD